MNFICSLVKYFTNTAIFKLFIEIFYLTKESKYNEIILLSRIIEKGESKQLVKQW